MASTPAGQPPLQLDQALRDGWAAFCRAPWSFVLFALLLTGVQIVLQPLQDLIQKNKFILKKN